jgi:hypothetical protein
MFKVAFPTLQLSGFRYDPDEGQCRRNKSVFLEQGQANRNRRQRAVRHGFNSRHMKGGMYTEGTGQQKTNSRGDNDLGVGKWDD